MSAKDPRGPGRDGGRGSPLAPSSIGHLQRLRFATLACLLLAIVVMSLFSAAMGARERTEETVVLAAELQSEVRRAPGREGRRLTESFVAAARAALAPGESWELITPVGRCHGRDGLPPGNGSPRVRYVGPYFWLAFRLMPNPADCSDPDVLLYWRVAPPPGSSIVALDADFAIARP